MIENRFRARFRDRGLSPMLLAHRGDSYHAPENTIEAAQRGLEAGADGWELDVHLTRDGIPVVIHDETLLRTTDVARVYGDDPRASSRFPVVDFLFDEIRRLDAGSWFVEPSGGYRSAAGFGTLDRLSRSDRDRFASGSVIIPTLADALELTLQADWLVNIEIKPTPDQRSRVVEAVLALVNHFGLNDRVTISSFDHPTVGMVAAIDRSVATGLLISEPLDRPAGSLLEEFGADAIHASLACCLGGSLRIHPSLDGPADRFSVPVLVYTLNDSGPSGPTARLAEAGVSGWFTDDPRSFRPLGSITPS